MKTKTFNNLKFTVLGLLLLSFISALLMLPAFSRNSEMRTWYLLDAAKHDVVWEQGGAVVKYAKADSDDIRIVAYVKGQNHVVPDFKFSSLDAILTELSKLPAGENLVKRDDIGIQHMFARVERNCETSDAFIATKLYPDVFSRGLSFALLIVNFIALAASLAILWHMYKTVTRHISQLPRKLQDLPDDEAEKWLKNYVSEGQYPLWEIKFLAERLRDFLEIKKILKSAIDKFDADRTKIYERVTDYLKKGQRVAAEYTRMRSEHNNVDFYLIDCDDLDDFDVVGDTIQSCMAALLRKAVEYAVERDAEEIYLSLQDDEESDNMIFEIRDNGDEFNEDSMPEPMKTLIDESRAEGFDIDVDSQDGAFGCVLKLTF